MADRRLTGDTLSIAAAAKVLGSSEAHVKELCDNDDLPFAMIGGERRIYRAVIEAYADDGASGSATTRSPHQTS